MAVVTAYFDASPSKTIYDQHTCVSGIESLRVILARFPMRANKLKLLLTCAGEGFYLDTPEEVDELIIALEEARERWRK